MKRLIITALCLFIFIISVSAQFLPPDKCYYNGNDCDAKYLPVMSVQMGNSANNGIVSAKIEGGYMGTEGRPMSFFAGVNFEVANPTKPFTSILKGNNDTLTHKFLTTAYFKVQYRLVYIKEAVSLMVTAGPQITTTISRFDFTGGVRMIVPFGERFGLTGEGNYLIKTKKNQFSVGLVWMVN